MIMYNRKGFKLFGSGYTLEESGMGIGKAQFSLPNGGQNLLKFGIGH